jgi:hypothetical protein
MTTRLGRLAAFALLLILWSALAQRTVRAGIVAADSASDPSYAAETGGAWKGLNPAAGENPPGADNGGSGFQPWNFAGGFHYPADSPYGELNHFIDGVDFTHSSFNDLGAPAFGLTNANVAFGGSTARATRTFDSPLTVGTSVTLNFDNPVLATYNPQFPDPAGYLIRLNTGGGPVRDGNGVAQRFGIFTTSGYINGRWATTDSAGNLDSGLSSTETTSGATFRFTLTATEAYLFEILPLGGGPALFTKSGTLAGAGADAIDTLEILMFGNGSGNGVPGPAGQTSGEREFFFNSLSVANATVGNADYDDDSDVDGADFLIWQQTLGSETELAADGNQNGKVDAADLDLWKLQFGVPAAASGIGAVPEPTATTMALGAALALFAFSRRLNDGPLVN